MSDPGGYYLPALDLHVDYVPPGGYLVNLETGERVAVDPGTGLPLPPEGLPNLVRGGAIFCPLCAITPADVRCPECPRGHPPSRFASGYAKTPHPQPRRRRWRWPWRRS